MYFVIFLRPPTSHLPHTHTPVYIWCHNLGKERWRHQTLPFFFSPVLKISFLPSTYFTFFTLHAPYSALRTRMHTLTLGPRTGNTKSQSWCAFSLCVSLACLSAKETNVKAISALWRSLDAHAPARKLSVLKSIFKLGKLDVCTECLTSNQPGQITLSINSLFKGRMKKVYS